MTALILNFPDKNKRTLPKHEIIFQDDNFLNKLELNDKQNFSDYNVILNEDIYSRYKEEIMSGIKISNKDFLNKIQSKYTLSYDIDKFDNKFEIPVLILTGKQDSIVGYQDAYNILENYTRATYLVLDNAGHNLQIEQSQIFTSIMSNWLNNFNTTDKMKAYWNKLFKERDIEFPYEQCLDRDNNFLKHKKLLDVASGDGRNLDFYLKHNFDVTCIDYSSIAIEKL